MAKAWTRGIQLRTRKEEDEEKRVLKRGKNSDRKDKKRH